MAHPWPLFDLRLRTPRLELRLPTDDDLLGLMEVARAGVHDPAATPLKFPWDELPSPAFERNFLLHWWASRGSWKPERWTLTLAAVAGGRPIGIQDLMARDFAHRRTVSTGSWLGQAYQRRGYGTEMRAAVLWLAFEGLGARMAESGYIEGNEASAGVAERLGYMPNGERLVAPRGEPLTEHLVRVTRETWRRDLIPVTVENLEPCLRLFGIGTLTPAEWSPI
ncbi:MAG: GNAT family N-acetyltransferase [Candidatus Limnocylindrales bacterium]|jgi:RimJ/RimL family protein N-acetyltransferase